MPRKSFINQLKSKIKEKFRWFNWHLFPQPEDVPIHSVYEIVFFLLIFSGCVYIYSKCNTIPYCTEEINIECLDNKLSGENNNYFLPVARINFRMPHTIVNELNNNGTSQKNNYLSICLGSRNLLQDTIRYNTFNHITDSMLETSKYITSEFRQMKDSLYPDLPISANRTYQKNRIGDFNKLYELYDILRISQNVPSSINSPLYYYGIRMTVRKQYLNIIARINNYFTQKNNWNSILKQDTTFGIPRQAYWLKHSEYLPSEILQEGFTVGTLYANATINDPFEISIGKPGWFSLEDISQTYYHFKIKSETIDSIECININFVGATEFSELVPEPDKREIGLISYFDNKKIKTIYNIQLNT